MPGSITTLLEELTPDTLTAQPGAEDETGTFVAAGTALSLTNCRISGKRRMARDASGREIVSNVHAVVLGLNALTVEGFRYALPSNRPEPRTNLKAISVRIIPDENGPDYEVVDFP